MRTFLCSAVLLIVACGPVESTSPERTLPRGRYQAVTSTITSTLMGTTRPGPTSLAVTLSTAGALETSPFEGCAVQFFPVGEDFEAMPRSCGTTDTGSGLLEASASGASLRLRLAWKTWEGRRLVADEVLNFSGAR